MQELITELAQRASRLQPEPASALLSDLGELDAVSARLRRIARVALEPPKRARE